MAAPNRRAVTAGAQWNVDGGPWQNSAATVTGLSVGSHTINYIAVAGWTAPASESVSIASDETTTISRSYTFIVSPDGDLQVTLAPADAVTAGAQWNVDGGAWQNSAATVTGLSVGSHTINYKAVASWTAPASESVSIASNETTTISRTYTSSQDCIIGGSIYADINDPVNSGVEGVTVAISSGCGMLEYTSTDAEGFWQYAVPTDCDYQVTPILDGYSFKSICGDDDDDDDKDDDDKDDDDKDDDDKDDDDEDKDEHRYPAAPVEHSSMNMYINSDCTSTACLGHDNIQFLASLDTQCDDTSWYFGNYDDTSENYSLTVEDKKGKKVTFRIHGQGFGEIVCDDNTFSQIILYNTTENSMLSIRTERRKSTSVGDIIVKGPLKALLARTTKMRGTITVDGSISHIALKDMFEFRDSNRRWQKR